MISPWDDLVRDLPALAVRSAMERFDEVQLAPGDLLVEADADTTDGIHGAHRRTGAGIDAGPGPRWTPARR